MSNKPYFRFWLQPRLKMHNPKCIRKILGQELALQFYNKLIGSFYTQLFNKCHNIFICIFCNKTNYLHLIYKCGSNMMPKKLKNQLICSYIKKFHLMKRYVLMSKIDQRMKIDEHITLETTMVVTIHPIYLPFTNFDNCYEITLKNVTQFGKFDKNGLLSRIT